MKMDPSSFSLELPPIQPFLTSSISSVMASLSPRLSTNTLKREEMKDWTHADATLGVLDIMRTPSLYRYPSQQPTLNMTISVAAHIPNHDEDVIRGNDEFISSYDRSSHFPSLLSLQHQHSIDKLYHNISSSSSSSHMSTHHMPSHHLSHPMMKSQMSIDCNQNNNNFYNHNTSTSTSTSTCTSGSYDIASKVHAAASLATGTTTTTTPTTSPYRGIPIQHEHSDESDDEQQQQQITVSPQTSTSSYEQQTTTHRHHTRNNKRKRSNNNNNDDDDPDYQLGDELKYVDDDDDIISDSDSIDEDEEYESYSNSSQTSSPHITSTSTTAPKHMRIRTSEDSAHHRRRQSSTKYKRTHKKVQRGQQLVLKNIENNRANYRVTVAKVFFNSHQKGKWCVRLVTATDITTNQLYRFIHGPDVAGLVKRKSNISRLLGQYSSPDQKMIMNVPSARCPNTGQPSNVLTIAGLDRLVREEIIHHDRDYANWLLKTCMPFLNGEVQYEME